MTRWFAWFVAGTVGLLGCGDDATEPVGGATDTEDSATADRLCTPGEMIPCMCPNGLDGFQECVGDGYVLTACECTDNEVTTSGPTTTGPDDTTSGSSTGTTSGSDTEGTGTTTGTGTDSGTDTDTEPVCGNGRVEGDEQCDDMNNVDDNACSNACIASCGLEWVQVERTEGTFDAGAINGAGNFIVAGLATDGQVVVSSFDTDGVQSWTQTFDLGADASVTDVAIDPNDAIVVGGENDTAGAPAIWLLKLDAAGAEQWRRTIGGGLGGTWRRTLRPMSSSPGGGSRTRTCGFGNTARPVTPCGPWPVMPAGDCRTFLGPSPPMTTTTCWWPTRSRMRATGRFGSVSTHRTGRDRRGRSDRC